MSKAITCDVILTGASTRSDGSLSLRLATPELDAPAKTAFFELLNRNLKALFQPVDAVPEELVSVAKEIGQKTASQRLRGILFIQFQQQREVPDFTLYYERQMQRICEAEKAKLEPSL